MRQESSSTRIAEYYSCNGLFESIHAELLSKEIKIPSRQDLAPFDEFHVRGAAVSLELAKGAGFHQHSRVLDLGCGLGGATRMIADMFDCYVTGVDITPEFIRTAELLSDLVGLSGNTRFLIADALQLPFPEKSFDVVWTQHVQMNIERKEKYCGEIKRILNPGGSLIYYDIFKKDRSPLHFPVPWAENPSLSFLLTRSAYADLLSESGFVMKSSKDQTADGITFLREQLDKMRSASGSKPGLQLIMGDSFSQKIENLLKNLEEGRIELQSGIYNNQ